MDKAMEALKPCPFCGSEAVRVDTYDVQPDDYHGGTVKCSNCDAEGADAISIDGWLASKEEAEVAARVAWNARATPEPVTPAPDIAGLVGMLRHLVSLNEPRHGGPYAGAAAGACVKAMAEAAGLLTLIAQERDAANTTISALRAEVAAAERHALEWASKAGVSEGLLAAANALADRVKIEAQAHASEARTANATIYEIYQVISGATGEPGNWHGAEPVRAYVEAAEARLSSARDALEAISSPTQTEGLLWWQIRAREALAELKGTKP